MTQRSEVLVTLAQVKRQLGEARVNALIESGALRVIDRGDGVRRVVADEVQRHLPRPPREYDE
jgi:hypothetical protein